MPPYFRYFSLSSRSSAICLLISRRWGLSAISMCQECCYLQRCFPAHQVYEAVEFSNDDPIVTKALKKKRVSAVKVTWGPEPTDFMCLACTIFELVVAVVELPRPQTFGHWLRMMLVVILKLKAGRRRAVLSMQDRFVAAEWPTGNLSAPIILAHVAHLLSRYVLALRNLI